ncbi:MAG: hypothetical protein ACK5OC_14025 [Pirellula sp.]|jgi:hypothetical protein|nr:hypothetical protein [Planctomycetota bacterium]
MRTVNSFMAVGFLGLANCGVLLAQEPRKPEQPEVAAPKVSKEQPISFWMAKKLDYSKSILESLTKGDFEKLEQDASQMRMLGKMEALVRRNNPNYRSQLQAFDLANNELVRQAKRKNAEGATMAFNQLTTSCVACHVLLREDKD